MMIAHVARKVPRRCTAHQCYSDTDEVLVLMLIDCCLDKPLAFEGSPGEFTEKGLLGMKRGE